jgi:hypothetical protein
MEIGFIVAIGVGVVIGMYITSQISESINSKTRQKKFMKNMENFDKNNK